MKEVDVNFRTLSLKQFQRVLEYQFLQEHLLPHILERSLWTDLMMTSCCGRKAQDYLFSITPCCFYLLIRTWIPETRRYPTYLSYHGIDIPPGIILQPYLNPGMWILKEQGIHVVGISAQRIAYSITWFILSSNRR